MGGLLLEIPEEVLASAKIPRARIELELRRRLDLLLALPGKVCVAPAAAANGLAFTGTLGILAAAKARGQVESLFEVLQSLKSEARFWISPQLERSLLEEAGEIG